MLLFCSGLLVGCSGKNTADNSTPPDPPDLWVASFCQDDTRSEVYRKVDAYRIPIREQANESGSSSIGQGMQRPRERVDDFEDSGMISELETAEEEYRYTPQPSTETASPEVERQPFIPPPPPTLLLETTPQPEPGETDPQPILDTTRDDQTVEESRAEAAAEINHRLCYFPLDSLYQPTFRIEVLDPMKAEMLCSENMMCFLQEIKCGTQETNLYVIDKLSYRESNQTPATGGKQLFTGYDQFSWDEILSQTNKTYLAGEALEWNGCMVDKDSPEDTSCPDYPPPQDLFHPMNPWNILSTIDITALNPRGADVINPEKPDPTLRGKATVQGSRYNCCYLHSAMHPLIQALWQTKPYYRDQSDEGFYGWGIYSVYQKTYGGPLNPLFIVSRPHFPDYKSLPLGITCADPDAVKDFDTVCIYEEKMLLSATCEIPEGEEDLPAPYFAYLHKFHEDYWDIYLLDMNVETVEGRNLIVGAIRLLPISDLPRADQLDFVIQDCKCSR